MLGPARLHRNRYQPTCLYIASVIQLSAIQTCQVNASEIVETAFASSNNYWNTLKGNLSLHFTDFGTSNPWYLCDGLVQVIMI